MIKNLLLATVLSLLFTSITKAQIDPIYGQYLTNPLVINPAYTGLNNNFNTTVSYRKQWGGFEGSPSTVNFSATSAFSQNKMGLGFMVIQDNIGNSKNTEVNLTYAYKVDLGNQYLSFGLQGGFTNFRNSLNGLNPYDPTAPDFSTSQNFTKANLGAGVILKNERYFFGLSVPRILDTKEVTGTQTSQVYEQHYYATAAYLFYINDRVKFKPTFLFKGVKGAPLSTDFNAAFIFDEQYTAGIITRNLNTFGILAQAKTTNGFRFTYVFEMPTNRSVGFKYPTHEVSLGISLAILKAHSKSMSYF